MIDPNIDLTGRVALVTGSSRRVGRAILEAMAAAGASVVVNTSADQARADSAARELEERFGAGRAMGVAADVTDAAQVDRMIEAIVQRFGRLDILVNNANARSHAEAKPVTPAAWRAVLATVLDGAYHCSMAAAPHLAHGGAGRIINIAGVTAHTGARNHAHVVTAKSGLVGLTKALALDLGPSITVNCLSPALIVADDDDPRRVQRLLTHFPLDETPVGRTGTPEEVAAAVVALCGPSFAFMTGQTLHFNGGVYLGGA